PPPPESETGGCMQRFDDGCNNMRTYDFDFFLLMAFQNPLAHSPEGCRGSTNLLVSVIAHKDPLAARAFETTPEGPRPHNKGCSGPRAHRWLASTSNAFVIISSWC